VNAATQITATAEETPAGIVMTYRWTQYQVTATWTDQPTVVSPLAAMTREDAIAYTANAHTVLHGMAGFGRVKLSLVNRVYVERVSCKQDLSEDGDGSPITRHEVISGDRWEGHRCERNFNAEARAAETKCPVLQTYYAHCGY
jgi:hypothetical protein